MTTNVLAGRVERFASVFAEIAASGAWFDCDDDDEDDDEEPDEGRAFSSCTQHDQSARSVNANMFGAFARTGEDLEHVLGVERLPLSAHGSRVSRQI
jgi:hypothetical protein